MAPLRMMRLVTAADSFEARVIAARLGSEGVVWELRGGVDGPLALGAVEVLVAEDDYETARELLLADEVESAFDGGRGPAESSPLSARDLWWFALVVTLLVLFALARMGSPV